jgi:hypothetical protein
MRCRGHPAVASRPKVGAGIALECLGGVRRRCAAVDDHKNDFSVVGWTA